MSRVVAISPCILLLTFCSYLPSSKCKTATRLKFTRSRWAATDFSRRSGRAHGRGNLWSSPGGSDPAWKVATPGFGIRPICGWHDTLGIAGEYFLIQGVLTGKRIIAFVSFFYEGGALHQLVLFSPPPTGDFSPLICATVRGDVLWRRGNKSNE